MCGNGTSSNSLVLHYGLPNSRHSVDNLAIFMDTQHGQLVVAVGEATNVDRGKVPGELGTSHALVHEPFALPLPFALFMSSRFHI